MAAVAPTAPPNTGTQCVTSVTLVAGGPIGTALLIGCPMGVMLAGGLTGTEEAPGVFPSAAGPWLPLALQAATEALEPELVFSTFSS